MKHRDNLYKMRREQLFKHVYHLLIVLHIGSSGLCIENPQVNITPTISEKVSLNIPNIGPITIPIFENSTISTATEVNSQTINSSVSTKKSDKFFTPSFHIGPIDTFHDYKTHDMKPHPFNNIQHFELGNSAVGDITSNIEENDTGTVSIPNPQSIIQQMKYIYETNSGDTVLKPINHHNYQLSHPQQTHNTGYVTADPPSIPLHIYNKKQNNLNQYITNVGNYDLHQQPQFNHHHHHQQPLPAPPLPPPPPPPHHNHYNQQEQQQQKYYPDPAVQHIIYRKPLKHKDMKPGLHYYEHYEYIIPDDNDAVKNPEMDILPHTYRHHFDNNQQYPYAQTTIPDIDEPETVLYLTSHHETSFMRTRKFPYKHYQPGDDTEIHLVEDEHAFPAQRRQISPWHKIIHIIGTFLPLGLLIAALKPPNVIKMDSNNTEPNTMLSKPRAIHLPIEHKESPSENENLCENRLLCESIIRSMEINAKLIDKILTNLRTKSVKQDEVRKREVNEIFEAVQKKDCNFIKC